MMNAEHEGDFLKIKALANAIDRALIDGGEEALAQAITLSLMLCELCDKYDKERSLYQPCE